VILPIGATRLLVEQLSKSTKDTKTPATVSTRVTKTEKKVHAQYVSQLGKDASDKIGAHPYFVYCWV